MSAPRKLDITIAEAQLVRIFDSLKPNQDVFVQLVCGYADGSEKVVGRTETCKNGNFHPRWNERFLCGRDADRGSRTLKFRVNIDHLWRNPVLCGEAEFSLDNLWSRAMNGPQKVPVPLFKRGEQTGMLTVTIATDSAGRSLPMSAASNGYPTPSRDTTAASADPRLATPLSASAGSGATAAATPGGASTSTAYHTPAGTPYGTPAGEAGPRLAQMRSPMGAPRYELFPQAADGLSPPAAALQQHLQAHQPSSAARHPPPQAQAQPPAARQQPPPRQQARPGPGPAAAPPATELPAATLDLPTGRSCHADAGRDPGSQVQPPGPSIYASGASGQWWNSFIDRG